MNNVLRRNVAQKLNQEASVLQEPPAGPSGVTPERELVRYEEIGGSDASTSPPVQNEVVVETTGTSPVSNEERSSVPSNSSSRSVSSSLPTSSSSRTGSSTAAIAPLVELNASLKMLGESPVVPSTSKKPYILRKKLAAVTEKIAKPFSKFSLAGALSTPKTRKGVTTRQCQLLNELSAKFKMATSSSDKYKILTSIPKRFSLNQVITATGCGQHTARHASMLKDAQGAFSWPLSAAGRPNIGKLKDDIIAYYLMDKNSRRSPNARDVIFVRDAGGARVPEEKRHILHNLKELYEMFREENPQRKVGLTSFSLLRPKQCVWPGRLQHQVVCVCEIHKNFEFLLNAAKCNIKVGNIIQMAVCGNDDCYLGLCGECPKLELVEEELFGNLDVEADEITYLQWLHTDRTEIKQLTSNRGFQGYCKKLHSKNCGARVLDEETRKSNCGYQAEDPNRRKCNNHAGGFCSKLHLCDSKCCDGKTKLFYLLK